MCRNNITITKAGLQQLSSILLSIFWSIHIQLHIQWVYKEHNNCVQINSPLAARAGIPFKTPKAQTLTLRPPHQGMYILFEQHYIQSGGVSRTCDYSKRDISQFSTLAGKTRTTQGVNSFLKATKNAIVFSSYYYIFIPSTYLPKQGNNRKKIYEIPPMTHNTRIICGLHTIRVCSVDFYYYIFLLNNHIILSSNKFKCCRIKLTRNRII